MSVNKSKLFTPLIVSSIGYTYRSSGDFVADTGVTPTSFKYFESIITDDSYLSEYLAARKREDGSFDEIGVASLDTIFVGYSTYYDNSTNLPHFETPSVTGEIDSYKLNPFNPGLIYGSGNIFNADVFESSGHNIQAVMTYEQTATIGELSSGIHPVSHQQNVDFNARQKVDLNPQSVGLRSPLVLTGWGFDTEGYPVPSGGSGNFATNAFHDTSIWKTGPVDLRWDNERKVWTGGLNQTARFKINEPAAIYNGSHPSGALASRLNSNDGIVSSGERIYADYVRDVYVQNDIIWCEKVAGIWQIHDHGTTQWLGTTAQDLVSGVAGNVSLYNGSRGSVTVSASIIDTTDSLSSGTQCLIQWIDGYQEFIALPIACPNPIVQG